MFDLYKHYMQQKWGKLFYYFNKYKNILRYKLILVNNIL